MGKLFCLKEEEEKEEEFEERRRCFTMVVLVAVPVGAVLGGGVRLVGSSECKKEGVITPYRIAAKSLQVAGPQPETSGQPVE